MNKESLNELGYSTFRSDLTNESLNVARKLGDLYDEDSIPLVQTLTPKTKDDVKNTYSGIFGFDSFPMHTDLSHWFAPPRYLLLRCLTPSAEVSTNILDSRLVLEGESISSISKSHFRPRKHLKNKTNLLKVYNDGIYRWDSVFMKPANQRGKELQSRFLDRIEACSYEEVFFEEAGDCLLIDNWRMMHGRGQIPSCSKGRKIERVYLSEIYE